MEIIQINSSDPQTQNATADNDSRRRSATTRDGSIPKRQRRRVELVPSCVTAFYALKHELGFRSDADIVHWLLHQSRPQLVPAAPSPPNSPPSRNSSLCMDLHHLDKLDSSSDPPPRLPIKASVVQASTVFFDTPATLEKAERMIAGAAEYGSQLVVFPEAFIGGYPLRSMKFDIYGRQKYRASAVDVPGPETDMLAKFAAKYEVHLVMGVVERTASSLFSTLVFFDSSGVLLGKQRKLMLMPSETAVWHSGKKKRMSAVNTSIGKIGGVTCWDNKSPFLRSELYANGVEIYCAPSSDSSDVWKSSVIHVAVEGSCFVLSANQCEDSAKDVSAEGTTCCGGSLIVSPLGNILAGPKYEGECLLSADLDLQEIKQAKMEFGVTPISIEESHDIPTGHEDDQYLVSVEVKEDPQLLSSDLLAA